MLSKWWALAGGIAAVMASSSALFLPLLLRTDSTLDSRVMSTVRKR